MAIDISRLACGDWGRSSMQLGSGGPPHVAAVLGAALALGAVLWGAPLYVLAPDAQPAAARFAILLLPSVLATIMLAFAIGFWLGRRRRALQAAPVLAASQSRLAAEQMAAEQRRIALLLDCAAPGAALFDAGQHLVAWNRGFAALPEVPEAALHPGLPLA